MLKGSYYPAKETRLGDTCKMTSTENFPEHKMGGFKPDDFRDGLCHCPSANEDEMNGNQHKVCGGIRNEAIEKPKKRRTKAD